MYIQEIVHMTQSDNSNMEWGICKAWVFLMREITVAIGMCSHHNGHCTLLDVMVLGCIVGRHCIHWKRASAGGTGHRPHTQWGGLGRPLACAVIAVDIMPHWVSWWQLDASQVDIAPVVQGHMVCDFMCESSTWTNKEFWEKIGESGNSWSFYICKVLCFMQICYSWLI